MMLYFYDQREVLFNENVYSICFLNKKGDLLIGLDTELDIIKVKDCKFLITYNINLHILLFILILILIIIRYAIKFIPKTINNRN